MFTFDFMKTVLDVGHARRHQRWLSSFSLGRLPAAGTFPRYDDALRLTDPAGELWR